MKREREREREKETEVESLFSHKVEKTKNASTEQVSVEALYFNVDQPFGLVKSNIDICLVKYKRLQELTRKFREDKLHRKQPQSCAKDFRSDGSERSRALTLRVLRRPTLDTAIIS